MQSKVETKISRKSFINESKRYKRKNHLTADEAKDHLARSLGYDDYTAIKDTLGWK